MTRILSTLLSIALVNASVGSAWAVGAKAVSGRMGSGNSVTGFGTVGISGSLGIKPGLKIDAPTLGGTLPILSAPAIGIENTQKTALKPLARPAAVAPAVKKVSAATTVRAAVSKQLTEKTVSIQPDIQVAADLGSVSAENASGTGISLAAKVFGFSPRSRTSGMTVNAADDAAMKGKLKFSGDWIDPTEAYDSVYQTARTAMRNPSVSYADADLEVVDGELRVSAVRYALFDTLSELAGRFSFIYKVDAKAPEGRFDELRSIHSLKNTGGMLRVSLEPRINLKNALIRLHRTRPDFEPKRVVLYEPSSLVSVGRGLVYRFTDNKGSVLEIDAKTGRFDGDPILLNDSLADQLKLGVVPVPQGTRPNISVPKIEAASPWPVRLAGVVVASMYSLTALVVSYALGWPLVGAAFAVFFSTGIVGLMTYVSALRTTYSIYGTETFVTNPKRAKIGEALLNAGILFGAVTMALVAFAPAATAVGLLGISGMVRRDRMVQPSSLYERAYAEALEHSDGSLQFSEATISSPIHDGDHWKFNFYSVPEGEGAKAKMISIDFHRGGGWTASGGFYTKVHTYKDVALPADQPIFPISADVFAGAVKMSPEEALTEAQRAAPAMRGGVSISLRAEVQGENGERGDFRYRFFDNSGYEVAVNARSREVNVLTEPRVETREERLERFKTWKSFRDVDMWLGEHLPLYAFLKWAAIIGAVIFLFDMFFNIPAMLGAVGVLGAGGYLVRRDSMPKPVDLYARALKEAREGSDGMPVKFVRATASYPLTDQKWIYTFQADHPKHDAMKRLIDISFTNGITVLSGQFETRRRVYTIGEDLAKSDTSRALEIDAFSTVARITPDEALSAAKRKNPQFGTARSGIELTAKGGSAGMSYRIYDEKGNMAAVDAVNGEVFKSVAAPVPTSGGLLNRILRLIK